MNSDGYKCENICKSTCKGKCCRSMGCHFSPDDFKEISFDYLKREIDKGNISIDWWVSDEPQYFLRMRNINSKIIDPSWGGQCILWTEKGCSLKFEERPKGARMLKPNLLNSDNCKQFYSKESCKDDWLEYSDILNRLVEIY